MSSLTKNKNIYWIAVDWGTTNFRAWLMDVDGNVHDEIKSADGIKNLVKADFETVFYSKLQPWQNSAAIALMAGMVGSQQGWKEAPYVNCGVELSSIVAGAIWPLGKDFEHSSKVLPCILPGLKFVEGKFTDVMRGEEVQLLGFLTSHKKSNSWLVGLPGTHSKWAFCKNRRVESFTTYMTGEVFELLCKNSILQHSVVGAVADAIEVGFIDGLEKAQTAGGLLGKIFTVRSGHLLTNTSSQYNKSFLSGLMIGDELKNISIRIKKNIPIAIIADDAITNFYKKAADFLDMDIVFFSAKQASLLGLQNCFYAIKS